MFYVIYRDESGHRVFPADFDAEEDARDRADMLRKRGITGVQVLVDLDTADETARAMAFTIPVRGTVGPGTWHDRAAATLAPADRP